VEESFPPPFQLKILQIFFEKWPRKNKDGFPPCVPIGPNEVTFPYPYLWVWVNTVLPLAYKSEPFPDATQNFPPKRHYRQYFVPSDLNFIFWRITVTFSYSLVSYARIFDNVSVLSAIRARIHSHYVFSVSITTCIFKYTSSCYYLSYRLLVERLVRIVTWIWFILEMKLS
jgi:hypothetical protein